MTRSLVALAVLAGCGSPERSPTPIAAKPAAPIVADAAPDAAPVVALRSVALPVGVFEGAHYYALEAHVDGPGTGDPSAWSDAPAENSIGVRAAPHAPPPWSSMIGRRLDAYDATGTACPVRVSGVYLFGRLSGDRSMVLGKLEPIGSCVPVLVSDRVPKVFELVDASAADRAAVQKALAAEPEHREFLEKYAHATKRVDQISIARDGATRFAIVSTMREAPSSCGTDAADERAIFALGAGAPVQRAIGVVQPNAATRVIDWNGDGTPELLLGATTWDAGMTAGTQLAAIWPSIDGVDLALSYYAGCD